MFGCACASEFYCNPALKPLKYEIVKTRLAAPEHLRGTMKLAFRTGAANRRLSIAAVRFGAAL